MLRKDIEFRFLLHTVTLNGLFVHLCQEYGGGIASAALEGWKWISGETVRLPWHAYNVIADKATDHLIQPDAVLEITTQRRRIFLECEMGTHSIKAQSDEKKGATMAKVERYESFITERSDFMPDGKGRTFYERSYPDRFTPQVVFLVQSPIRRGNINAAIAERQPLGPKDTTHRALTFDEAKQEFGALVRRKGGRVAPPRSASRELPPLSRQDVSLLSEFFVDTIGTLRNIRARSRSLNVTVPPYPVHAEAVKALLARLSNPSPPQGSKGAP